MTTVVAPGAPLLAIDTSTSGTLVVACDGRGTIAQRRHQPAAGERPAHTTLGLVLAKQALDELGLDWADLQRIGVGTGPGSFTGLRAGLAAAAGLAQRLAIPLVGSTASALLAAGADASHPGRPVLCVIDGRRRELFVERWTPRTAAGDGPLRRWECGGLTVVHRSAASEQLGDLAGVLAVGDGAVLERSTLLALGADVPAETDAAHQLSAHALAALTASGDPMDAGAVQPTYGRDADAVPTAERAVNR